jgi:hypothetical protein
LTPIWAYRSPLKISKIGWVCALTFGLKGLRNDHTYKMVTTPKERKGDIDTALYKADKGKLL